MTAQRRRWTTVFLLALFLAAFIPRALYPVSRPLQWYERSFRFTDAVLHGRWADTIVSEHPGVTPMWLIGLAQHGYYALLKALGASPPHPLDIAGRAFRTEVTVSVLPLAAAIALGVLLTWRLLRDLFGEAVAWAGAGFLAVDPFHIAISKVVHVDALLSVLMILSALTLLCHLRRSGASEQARSFWRRHRLLLASGALAGLAFLTKSPAYFLVPFLGLSLVVTRGRARVWQDYLAPALLWAGAAAITYVAFWPAMWVQPGQTLATVLGGVLKHTGRAHPQPLYYLGELTTEDPGPGFYAVTLLVKTTALSLPLFVIGLFGALMATWRRERRSLVLLSGYFVFFCVQMGLGAKKAPRYLLPAFPALDIIAGVGLVTLARRVAAWKARCPPSLLVAVALAAQAALVWPYHPYYITHASLLVGGPAGAQRLLLATPEGEGLDLVADYLNHLPEAGRLRVGVQMPAREAFRQHFVGEVADTREPDLDYLVFAEVYVRRHMAEDQWGAQWETYRYRLPAYMAYLHGLPYAWLYRVDDGPQPPAVPLGVCLGAHIRMLGYTLVVDGAPLDGRALHPGESLRLTLHWTATGPPEGDYSVFVHLLGPDGTLVTQQDNPPLRGTYPTFLWGAGERVDDPYELAVPSDAPPGPYTLVAGMYDWRTGERLPALADCASPLPEDRIVLAAFDVRAEGVRWWQMLVWTLAAGGLILVRPGFAVGRTGLKRRCWMSAPAPPVHSGASWRGFAVGRTGLKRRCRMSAPAPPVHGGASWRWWVPLAYTLITLAMTYPAVLHLGDRVLSGGPDTWIFWWNNWWVKRALTAGESTCFTRHLFFPHGVDLTYHSFSWLNTALWLLLEPLIGAVAAYNLSVLWVFPLAGWGMERLVRELTGSKSAAFLAGLVYAFAPYRLGQYNHPNLMGTQWLPFYTLYLLRAIRSGRWRHVLPASLFLILTALVGWNLFLYLLIWTAFVGGYAWLGRMSSVRRLFGALARVLLIGVLVLSPLLMPLLVGRLGTQETLGDVQQDWMQTDLLAYVLPNRFHPLWGQAVEPLYGQLEKPWRVVYVGYGVMALLGYGLLRRDVRRRTGLWWCGVLLWWLMALGPFLKFQGQVYRNIPLPYYPLSQLYAFQLLKLPDRYNLMLSLPVAVVVGYAAADLLARLRSRWRAGVLVSVSALILFEYLSVPLKMQALQIPPFYERLAQEDEDLGIVELPIDFYDSAKRYMLYQTAHGHPIVEGHVSRRPPQATAFLDAHPLLRSLYQTQEIDPALTDVSRQLRALADVGFRYVVVHKQLTDAEHAAGWRDWLAIAPVSEDQEVIVYRTQPQYGRDFDLVSSYLLAAPVSGASSASSSGEIADGIGLIRAGLSTAELVQDGSLGATLVWGTRAAPGQDWLAQLALVSPSGSMAQSVDFEPCAGWPASEWGADAVARGHAALHVDPFIEGGTYTVTVGLVDRTTGAHVGRPLNVGRVEVQAVERMFERPDVEVPADVLFGDALRLLGYDLRQEAPALHVTLHWQARRRMELAYKFFVHLLDAETGELVAQADVMPRDWTYPTTWWENGEVVSDEITLATSDVPPGAYRVAIGVYDPETGARLPATDAAGTGRAEGQYPVAERLVLP